MEALLVGFLNDNASNLSVAGAMLLAIVYIFIKLGMQKERIKDVEQQLAKCQEVSGLKRDHVEREISELKSQNANEHKAIFTKLEAIYDKLIINATR